MRITYALDGLQIVVVSYLDGRKKAGTGSVEPLAVSKRAGCGRVPNLERHIWYVQSVEVA